MNYRTLVKGAFALSLSLIVGTAWAADTQTYGVTFEPLVGAATVENDHNYTNNMPIADATLRDEVAGKGWFAAPDDESKIIERIAEGSTQALQLNTDAGTLTNKFASDVATGLNAAIAGDGAFFETEVKFVASDTLDAGIPGGQDATKFAIYAYCDETDPENITTNLVVFHKYIDGNSDPQYTNEVFKSVNIDCEVYTKLRIEMKQVINPTTFEPVNVFSVKVGDGAALTSDLAFTEDRQWFLTVEDALGTLDGTNEGPSNTTVSSLNFKGTGEIDNIKVGTILNYVPDANWTIEGFNPRNEWTDPTAVAADSKTLFYSNIVVNIDATGEGRNIVAAWVGAKVTASEAASADLTGWKFDYDSQSGRSTGNAFAAPNLDGDNFLYWWVPITAAEVRTAIANDADIVKTMVVYTDTASSAEAQTLTVSICPKNIQITNTGDVANGEKIKVVNGVEQYDVSWTVDNVSVTAGGAAATAGYFAPNTVLTFTPDTGMVITNIDGQAVANLATFDLTVTQSTNITVKAGTVSAERVKPAWAADADTTKFWDWVDLYNVDYSTDYTAQYLMNVDPSKTPVLKIDSIAVTAEGSQIVVSATDGTDPIDLAAINGVLNVSVGSSVSALTSKDPDKNATFADNKATVIIKTADGAFAKATVDFVAAETKLSQVE